MPYTIEDLLALFDLEPIEENIYRGQNRDIGSGRLFGGPGARAGARRRTTDDRR